MNDASRSASPQLIAFAFVQEEFAKSGDLVRALLPLFAPVLAKRTLQKFDPETFSRAVEETFDIPMSPLVAEGLVPQLAAAGLLVTEPTAPNVYRIARAEIAPPDPAEVSKYDELLDEFVNYSKEPLERAGLKISRAELIDGFVQRLTRLEFISFLERPDPNLFKGRTISVPTKKDSTDAAPDASQALDVLAASFAIHSFENDAEKFQRLCRLGKGALVSKVVLTLQTPSADSDLSSVTLVLDGPLILDLLDLSTPELRAYATDFFELLEKSKVRKAVFAHTVEEMQSTIRGPLEALARNERPYGPLGLRIRHSSSHLAYARAALVELPQLLQKSGIEVIDAATYDTTVLAQYCPEEIEDSIRNNLGIDAVSFDRRQRDARSIATILRMRNGGANPQSLPDARFLLATRNDRVSEFSQKTLIAKNRLRKEDYPPALTDRQLAGVLWFAVGGSLGAMSQSKLIANCSAALNPRNDISSKLSQFLYENDPQKVEVFTALMRDSRARRALMHDTLGFAAAVTRDNAEYLLEQMRLATAAEVRKEANQREERLISEHEATLAAQTNTYRESALEKEAELLRVQTARNDLEAEQRRIRAEHATHIESLTTAVGEIRNANRQDVNRRVEKAQRFANGARSRLKALIIVLYATCLFAVWTSPSDKLLAGIASVALAIIGFWFIPQVVFEKLLAANWRTDFKRECRRLLVEDSLKEFEVDAHTGTASRRENHNLDAPAGVSKPS